jgi:hypothetical protein
VIFLIVQVEKLTKTLDSYEEWEILRREGYRCDDFEVYYEDGELLWDGVFRYGGGGNEVMWRDLDHAGFFRKWEEQSQLGYRLVDLETYLVGGQRRWAGLFNLDVGQFKMVLDYRTDDFRNKQEELRQQGYQLIDIETYTMDGQRYWAGVWNDGRPDSLLDLNLSTTAFGALRTQRETAGWRLRDIEAYIISNQLRRWAGIWEPSNVDEQFKDTSYCEIVEAHKILNETRIEYEMFDLEKVPPPDTIPPDAECNVSGVTKTEPCIADGEFGFQLYRCENFDSDSGIGIWQKRGPCKPNIVNP